MGERWPAGSFVLGATVSVGSGGVWMTPWEVDAGVVLEVVRASHRCVLEVHRNTFELPDDIRSLDEVPARFVTFALGEYLANRGADDTWDERDWRIAGDTIAGYVHNRDNWAEVLKSRQPISVTFAGDPEPDMNSSNGRINGCHRPGQ